MIQLDQVSKRFQNDRVLDGVSLRIEDGDRVALVGANGAGKTTLIRCLLGEYACGGRVAIDGLPPRKRRREVLGRVGFVPQLPPPLKMPVGELFRFAAALCGVATEAMEQVAIRLGLDAQSIWRRPFAKLSGGQKQKLLIAVALGRDTDLVVMDEPAANLDPEARRAFFDLLAERPEHSIMLLSSHRLDEVAPLVNRVVELERGRVVLDDSVREASSPALELRCRLQLTRADEAAAAALAAWSLTPSADGLAWEGSVAGADRLRFLGMISRYSGLLEQIDLESARPARQ